MAAASGLVCQTYIFNHLGIFCVCSTYKPMPKRPGFDPNLSTRYPTATPQWTLLQVNHELNPNLQPLIVYTCLLV